jgi:hypothetical protein
VIGCGTVTLGDVRYVSGSIDAPEGWGVNCWRYDAGDRAMHGETYRKSAYHCMGFAYFPEVPPVRVFSQTVVWIPIWFLVVVSGGLLWAVWGKTRGKAGEGLSVEAGGK